MGDYRSPEVGNVQGVTNPSRLNCLDHPMDYARIAVYDGRLWKIEAPGHVTRINDVSERNRGCVRDSWLWDIKDPCHVTGVYSVSERRKRLRNRQ